MTNCLIDFLKEQDVEFIEGFNVKDISSIGIGGTAELAVMPNSEQQLIKTVRRLTDLKIEYKIVGNATNILFSDDPIGKVLVLTRKIKDYCVHGDILEASCGTVFSGAIRELARMGYGGLCGLYGIPGSVGGMVFGNAGAFGCSVSDVLICARIYSPESDEIKVVSNGQMRFSYRSSALRASQSILLSAYFKLSRNQDESPEEKLFELIRKRRASQPSGKSLGSIFKRADGRPVSALIDSLGLKGTRIGGAEISEKHAGFIVNTGGATSRDVRELIALVKDRINQEYGFIPEEEIETLE